MDYQSLVSQFKQGRLNPVYFLTGDEGYFIDKVVEAAEKHIIAESEREFNQTVVYGRDITCRQLMDYCRTFPFLGRYRLVVVKEAQELKGWDDFIGYVQQPAETTVLVIAYKNKKPDGRSAWVKLLKEKTFWYESKALYDHQLPAFVQTQVYENGLTIDGEAAHLLVDFIGNDLAAIENEILKIKLNLAPNTPIQKSHIYEFVGISREYNVFELQRAIGLKQTAKALHILQNMALHVKSNPLIPTIAALYAYFNKIWIVKHNLSKTDQALAAILNVPFAGFIKEYRSAAAMYSNQELEQSIHLLHEYDLKAKGVYSGNRQDADLLMELGLKILLN